VTFALALSAAPARSIEAVTADDTARFLAGLQPSSNSPLAVLTNDPAWLSHARNLDSIFAREENKHDTMLYMFSGPDFLYAASFFPNASTYVLAGLETGGLSPRADESQPLDC
jgi:hypothetical protein